MRRRVWLLACVVLGVAAVAKGATVWVDLGPIWAPDTGKISLPSVIVDPARFGEGGSDPDQAPLYKMYYSDGAYPECDEIHLAVSPDGVTWQLVGPVLYGAKRPAVVYSAAGFGSGDSKYMIWYTIASDEAQRQQTGSFKVCRSADGVTWSEPEACTSADPARPLLASGTSPEDQNAWNRGSYGILRAFFNPQGAATVTLEAPMSNRYVMYYNVYGADAVSAQEGGLDVTSSIAMAVSADGVAWSRVGDAPVLRGWPSVTGGMISFADIVKQADHYELCFMVESNPTEGYIRRIGQAASTDGASWTVTSQDIAVLKTDDGEKGTYGLSMAVDPNNGELLIWLAAGDGPDREVIKLGRQE